MQYASLNQQRFGGFAKNRDRLASVPLVCQWRGAGTRSNLGVMWSLGLTRVAPYLQPYIEFLQYFPHHFVPRMMLYDNE